MSQGVEFWSAHLSAIDAAGMTAKAYAEQHGLSLPALYYWRKRLKRPSSSNTPTAGAFVPVQLMASGATKPAPCTLVLAPGVRLELAHLPSADWLAMLGRALQGAR